MATDHCCRVFFALQSMKGFDGPRSRLTSVTNLWKFLHQAKGTLILFLSCHLPHVPASQLLAVLLSYFSAHCVRCSHWPGCILAAGYCLTWRRGEWWQHDVSKWGSLFAGADQEANGLALQVLLCVPWQLCSPPCKCIFCHENQWTVNGKP